MTLSFSQKYPERMGELAGQPNYFIQKIWNSNPFLQLDSETLIDYYSKYECKFKHGWNQNLGLHPKLHTIREDKADRWKSGRDIHFVINNRTKNRFQFAPIIQVTSIQKFEISYVDVFIDQKKFTEKYTIKIDGRKLDWKEIEVLAKNDGFDSTDDFIQFFNKDFKGKIIHWTDLKY